MTNNKQAVSPLTDTFKREQIKGEILKLAQAQLIKPDSGMQFEGINFANPTMEGAALLLILQEICTVHREYSLVNWTGGVSLVRTADVDKLRADMRDVNEKNNFIIKGGTDKAADLANNVATPAGGEKE